MAEGPSRNLTRNCNEKRAKNVLRNVLSRIPGDRFFKVAPKHLPRRQKDRRDTLHETVMKNVQKTRFGTLCPEFLEEALSERAQKYFWPSAYAMGAASSFSACVKIFVALCLRDGRPFKPKKKGDFDSHFFSKTQVFLSFSEDLKKSRDGRSRPFRDKKVTQRRILKFISCNHCPAWNAHLPAALG